MKLLRLRVDGFGPLRGEWHFAPGKVNLVVDANERGKSSLLAAVAAALYGLEDDKRSHRVMTPRERYRPWNGGAYRVELELEAQGKRWRVLRDFERDSVSVFDDSGREATNDFLEGKDEYPVGRKLLGLDSAEFEKCALVRQGDLDQVVPGDEKTRRASTLRARLENAADTHIGDTNASEALRVLEEALRRYNAPELEFTGTVDVAIERLEAKRSLIEADLKSLDHQLQMAEGPLERLAQLAAEEEALKESLRRLEAERHAGLAAEVQRQLDEHERAREEVARLQGEADELAAVAQLPANAESELRETVARHEEAQRNLETLEARRREELDRDRAAIENELVGLEAYREYDITDADRCVALAAELRRAALDDTHERHQVFVLRDGLAAQGYEPERIQFLTARFGGLPEESQRLLRQQSELNLAFQTEVAGLEQERTQATEMLRGVDTARNNARLPGWIVLALGLAGVVFGGAVFAMKGALPMWAGLGGGGLVFAIAGAALLAIGSRAQAAEREEALKRLADAQRRLNTLRTQRAENEVGLAELSRLMGYRDSIDLMRHWNEYARMIEDSAPLLRAQEQLAEAEALRQQLTEQARPLLRAIREASVTPELLEKVAYDARRAYQARERLNGLDRSGELLDRERRVDEAAVAGLRERAIRILQSAGVAYDPAHTWAEHVNELQARMSKRDRQRMILDELMPFAKKQLLPDYEVEHRRKQLELLQNGAQQFATLRSAVEIDVEAKQTRERLELVQREREDRRIEVEEVWRRHTQQRPELESQVTRLALAAQRARAFKQSVELARTTIQKVAVDTHRRWADFLNQRVADVLRTFGTSVEHLRFGEDLDFSVQMDGGPQVSRGKAHLQLSSGARDQLYLAVRLAVSEFLSRGGEPMPLLLDDAFATSDDERLRHGMRALIEGFGAGHQLIVVTCHRGRHIDLKRQDPELYRDHVHWLEVGAGAPAQA